MYGEAIVVRLLQLVSETEGRSEEAKGLAARLDLLMGTFTGEEQHAIRRLDLA